MHVAAFENIGNRLENEVAAEIEDLILDAVRKKIVFRAFIPRDCVAKMPIQRPRNST